MELTLKHYTNIVAAIAAACLAAGCAPSATSSQFSPVLSGGFDPADALRKQGYTLQTEGQGDSTRNPVQGYGWQSWCGIVTGSGKEIQSKTIAGLLRDELNRVINGNALDELTTNADPSSERPMGGMLRYNKDGMHGDMHVWLIPDPAETSVSFDIFVREERLR